ncbi:MAG: histidinol dehydrogenase [Clostridiales Family XIII bacterium]|jgi:histidinol dehydrogenase|nr:histidinol dehydrogenase [Clostridiales Family XIII bacterium]
METSIIKIMEANGRDELLELEKMEKRAGERSRETEETVLGIIRDIKDNGDAALKKYSLRFDGGLPEQFEIGREQMKAAFDSADAEFKAALTKAAANIREYHELQQTHGYEISRDGALVGQIVRGLDRVGLYVPGGTAAYPSTVLMNGIPAKLAGVGELIAATPPLAAALPADALQETRHVQAASDAAEANTLARPEQGAQTMIANPDILAAAYLAGVDRVLLMGGAQAVAAMAYGTETVPRVDKIVGPGNIFVATAKRLLFGQVDIEMIAGPSEILIMADETAEPAYAAADMLSQAEHDVNAAAILLTTSKSVAEGVSKQLAEQLKNLERCETAKSSLKNHGIIIICRDLGEMCAIADRIAPEHLEILTEEPLDALKLIRNAGSVFCGEFAPEPLGDYYAGTNHVLPTSGTARFASPLGVYDFVKRMSYTFYTKEALEDAKNDIILIAEREGLTAHANAVRIRFGD